ncbi:MAG: alpha-2,8-polysialyltransferase family protein [bacterium]|nr:alpha-2,8-polysialyltransferase family protein [bacterium]
MSKKYIFRCNTPYHLMIAIIYMLNGGIKNDSIIIFKGGPLKNNRERKLLIDRCRSNGFCIINVEKKGKKVLLDIYKDNKIIKKCQKILNEKTFYLVNFRWNIEATYWDSYVYFKKAEEITLIEDGAASYANSVGSTTKRKLKQFLGLKTDFGKDRKIKQIYVVEPQYYPESYQHKLIRLDINCFIKKNFIVRVLTDVFLSNESNKDSVYDLRNYKVVVYTQPLSEDRYIEEKDKITIYERICEFYSQYGKVCLKIHPRDNSKYNFINVKIFGKDIPSELLNIIGLDFEYAIGICTSAIITSRALNKINLDNEFLKRKTIDINNINMYNF